MTFVDLSNGLGLNYQDPKHMALLKKEVRGLERRQCVVIHPGILPDEPTVVAIDRRDQRHNLTDSKSQRLTEREELQNASEEIDSIHSTLNFVRTASPVNAMKMDEDNKDQGMYNSARTNENVVEKGKMKEQTDIPSWKVIEWRPVSLQVRCQDIRFNGC